MPKACLNCGTDNRDEALFCRRCGTPFSSDHASPSTAEPTLPGERVPSDSPVQARAASLPPVAVPTPDFDAQPSSVFDADDDDGLDDDRTVLSAGTGFPARSAASDAEPTTLVLTPAPSAVPGPASLSPSSAPSVPSAQAAQVATGLTPTTRAPQPELNAGSVPVPAATAAVATAGTPVAPTGTPPRPPSKQPAALQRKPALPIGRWLAVAAGALLLIALGYWLLSPRTPRPGDQDMAAPAASAPVDTAPVAAEAPPASTAMTPPPPPQPASVAEPTVPVESTAAALPPASSASSAGSASAPGIDEAAKAARDKLERAARTKALREQAASAAAAKKADQELAAQRAAQERARAASPEPPPSAATSAPPATVNSSAAPRTAQDTCAGRGTIGTAICLSRECGRPEHVDEARCRQINAEEERRR